LAGWAKGSKAKPIKGVQTTFINVDLDQISTKQVEICAEKHGEEHYYLKGEEGMKASKIWKI